MKTTAIAVSLIVCAATCAMATCAPSMDSILAALRYQNTATVECVFTRSHVSAALSATAQFGDLTSPSVRYVRTPEILYQSTGDDEASSERTGITTLLDYRAKAAQRGAGESSGPIVGSIDLKTPARNWIIMDRMETVLYPMYPRKDDLSTCFLYGWVKYGTVLESVEAIDGHRCWKIDIRDTGDCLVDHYELWLDPAVGLNPRRIAMHGSDSYNGDWTVVVDSDDFREIDKGIWFPLKQTLVKSVPKKGVIDHRILFAASSLDGAKRYTKDELRVKLDD